MRTASRLPAGLPRRLTRAAGFTLVELLLVVAIIVIVVAFILISLNQLQTRARATACLANQRQIALANNSYATDNNGRFVSPRTDSLPPAGNMRGTPNPWVNTSRPGALVSGSETVRSLETGALWSYLGQNSKAYVSPMDPTGRVRSYSLSAFVGVGESDYSRRADDWYDFPDLESPDAPDAVRNRQFKTVTLSQIPQPSRTMLSIAEEDAFGYNFHGWAIEVGPPAASGGLWIDTPALWNRGRVNLSFLDGSVDAPNIIYEELARIMQPNPSAPPLHAVTELGARPAFRFMATILLPGVVRPELQ